MYEAFLLIEQRYFALRLFNQGSQDVDYQTWMYFVNTMGQGT